MRDTAARALAPVVAFALVCGCTGGGEPGTDELRSKAAALTDLMTRNDWPAVRQDFDATMREKLSEELLSTAWAQVTQARGAYRSRGEPTQIPKPGDVVVFDTPMTFERGEMKSRVSFRENGVVAGLFILEPSVL